MTLKPCLVLLVESPTLVLESSCRKPLLVGVLPVVENVEQGVRLQSLVLVQGGIIEDRQDVLRIVCWSVILEDRSVVLGPIAVRRFGTSFLRSLEKPR